MKLKSIQVFFLAAVLLSGCDILPIERIKPSKKPTGAVVAEIDGEYITLEELNAEIETFNSSQLVAENPSQKIETVEQKKDTLNSMINQRLIYREAIDRKMDKDPDYKRSVENFKITYLVSKLLSNEIKDLDVTQSDIENAYAQIKDRLKEPDQRKVREIVVSTKNEANEILSQLLMGSDFATMASQRSKVKSAAKGGDLGYITIGSKGADSVYFDNVVFSPTLEIGSLSQVFKGPEGYYIVKLEAKKEGRQPPLSEVQDQLKMALKQDKQLERFNNLVDKLRKQSKIETRKYENLIK